MSKTNTDCLSEWHWTPGHGANGALLEGSCGTLRGTVRRLTCDQWEACACDTENKARPVCKVVPAAEIAMDLVESYDANGRKECHDEP